MSNKKYDHEPKLINKSRVKENEKISNVKSNRSLAQIK